jgi:hypothetical protein
MQRLISYRAVYHGVQRTQRAAQSSPPHNVIAVTVRGQKVHSLVDSGSSQNIMSQRLYNRLFRSVSCSQENATTQDTDITLLSANASRMPIIATIDTDIRIRGLQIPVTFRVISDLIYDIILGEQFLQETEAIIDVGTNTLILYRGLLSVPMVKAHNLLVVKTTASITVPPFSQLLFQVAPVTRVKSGNYMIEGNLQPCTNG